MAQSLRQPPTLHLETLRYLASHPRCLHRRQFSHIPPLLARGPGLKYRAVEVSQSFQRQQKMKSMPSPMATAKKEQKSLTKEKLPRDLGLLPESFIPPLKGTLAPLYTKLGLKERRFVLWKRLKGFGVRWFNLYRYKVKIYPQPRKERPKLLRPPIGPTAKQLYTEIYEAYARGDQVFLEKHCAEGLFADFSRRLATREADKRSRMRWSVKRWLGQPKVIWHLGTELPFKVDGKAAGMRQIVVQLRSEQEVQVGRRRERAGKLEQGKEEDVEWQEPQRANFVDHIVLQRRLVHGVETDWEVWGFVGATDVPQLMRAEGLIPDLPNAEQESEDKAALGKGDLRSGAA